MKEGAVTDVVAVVVVVVVVVFAFVVWSTCQRLL
jgi:hypothetical protein